jgi:hypothetical protein
MTKGIDLESFLQCKTETLTLDLKSKDAKDRGGEGPTVGPASTAGVSLTLTWKGIESRARRTYAARRREGQGRGHCH